MHEANKQYISEIIERIEKIFKELQKYGSVLSNKLFTALTVLHSEDNDLVEYLSLYYGQTKSEIYQLGTNPMEDGQVKEIHYVDVPGLVPSDISISYIHNGLEDPYVDILYKDEEYDSISLHPEIKAEDIEVMYAYGRITLCIPKLDEKRLVKQKLVMKILT